MAGPSHSANIAHRKGVVDSKRAKLFTKLCRAIFVAAKNGGGDPDTNLRLRYAIVKLALAAYDSESRRLIWETGELVHTEALDRRFFGMTEIARKTTMPELDDYPRRGGL